MPDVPSGVYTFDPDKEPSGPRLPDNQLAGLTQANQQFDDGSRNASQQITTELDPWTQTAPTQGQIVQAIAAAQAPAAQAPAPPQDSEEIARLKKIVGDQGNTIGDLRKLLATVTDRLANQPAQHQATGQSVNLFRQRDPNDYPTAAEVQQALLQAGQELFGLINSRLDEVAVEAKLSSSGVTPEEAAMIRLEFPNLSALPAAERTGIINALLKARRSEAQASQTAAVQQATQTAQAGIRQQVYVPQPQPVSSVPQAGLTFDMDAFGNLKNSKQMEQALTKMGINRVNDIGRRG